MIKNFHGWFGVGNCGRCAIAVFHMNNCPNHHTLTAKVVNKRPRCRFPLFSVTEEFTRKFIEITVRTVKLAEYMPNDS